MIPLPPPSRCHIAARDWLIIIDNNIGSLLGALHRAHRRPGYDELNMPMEAIEGSVATVAAQAETPPRTPACTGYPATRRFSFAEAIPTILQRIMLFLQ